MIDRVEVGSGGGQDEVLRDGQAVQETLVFDLEQGQDTPDKGIVLTLSVAARDGRRTWMRYRSLSGEETERLFDPYGLVFQDGHWYATGYCHLRQSQRGGSAHAGFRVE